eukprot:2133289-Rhodomonas_salina.1
MGDLHVTSAASIDTPPGCEQPRKRRQAAVRAMGHIADIHRWEHASESSHIVRQVASVLNEQFSREASRNKNKGARTLVTPLDRQPLRGTWEGQMTQGGGDLTGTNGGASDEHGIQIHSVSCELSDYESTTPSVSSSDEEDTSMSSSEEGDSVVSSSVRCVSTGPETVGGTVEDDGAHEDDAMSISSVESDESNLSFVTSDSGGWVSSADGDSYQCDSSEDSDTEEDVDGSGEDVDGSGEDADGSGGDVDGSEECIKVSEAGGVGTSD